MPGQRRGPPQGHQPLLLPTCVVTLDLLQAIFKMISPEDVKHLPDDENTPEKRAEKIWGFFGKKDDGECLLPPYRDPTRFILLSASAQAGQGTPYPIMPLCRAGCRASGGEWAEQSASAELGPVWG